MAVPHSPTAPVNDTAGGDTTVVRAVIHPGIGVARIGNSEAEDGYFIGPEVVDPPPTPAGGNRDASGAIKRQAARFRLYGLNAAGEVVSELTAESADIQWQAHLVNRKAQWYRFESAMDLPAAATLSVPLRNPKITGPARAALAIDPGPRSIGGCDTSGPAYRFTGAEFEGVEVPLGELRTDGAGRLLVLGGLGNSASPRGLPVYDPADPGSFNNADGWYDDTSDGPVSAQVRIGGRDIPVDPAWVIVAPPDYAPDVVGWRTLYDLLVDTYITCGWLPMPEAVSFTEDILPVLQRLSNLQWVNKGFATQFGKGTPYDFENPTLIRRLAQAPAADGSDPWQELRRQVLNAFRPADNTVNDPRTWPWIYGDAFGSFDDSPQSNLALSSVRNTLLQRWVDGDFIDDYDPQATPPRALSEVPLAAQPDMLDRAALHFCLADAFHPGCELTWPMRHPTLYRAPFRIRQRPVGEPEPDYGTSLTQAIVLRPGGPLYAQGAGDLTRWMALPWQGDTAFCRSGYDPQYDPYVPMFWAARAPNQVLTEADYDTVMNTDLPHEARLSAYNRRAQWLRALHGPAPVQMQQMIDHFGEMGIVEARPGPENDPDIPSTLWVESLPAQAQLLTDRLIAAPIVAAPTDPVRQAGWEDEAQLVEFLRIKRRR